jgi:hypothetical protein
MLKTVCILKALWIKEKEKQMHSKVAVGGGDASIVCGGISPWKLKLYKATPSLFFTFPQRSDLVGSASNHFFYYIYS